MFFLLTHLINSGLYYTFKTAPDRAFDFRYGEDYQTTYRNFGWRVQLRTNTTNSSNPDKNVTYNALSENNGSISEENLTFISRFDKSLGDDYIRVIFDLTNNGNESKLFDIGVYADIQIGGDDRAAVLPLTDGKGFSMENKKDQDPRKGDILTLLVRDGYDVTNVDTLYWGQYDGDRSEIGRNVSNPDKPLENTDSVFEISWIGRVIKPGEKQSFNVLLIVGNKIKLPPIIHVNSFNKAQINETTFTVEGTFASVYDDSKIDLYYKYGDDGTEHKLDSLNASNGEKTKHFSIPLQCGPSKTKTLYIWALDEGRRRSNYEATIISTVKPSITIDHPPANGYTVGSDIKIKVKLSDDTSARIVYELDGKVVQGELIEINNEEKTKEIVINTANLSLSEHSLKVYVEDEYGYRSELNHDFKFSVDDKPRATVKETPVFTENSAKRGYSTTVNMKINNPTNSTYKVKAEFEGHEYIVDVPPSKDKEYSEVSLNITVPEGTEPGKHPVSVTVLDPEGSPIDSYNLELDVLPGSRREEIEQKEHEKPKNKNLWIIIGSIAAAFLIASSMILYFIFKKRDDDEEEEQGEKKTDYVDAIEINEETVLTSMDQAEQQKQQKVFTINIDNGEGEEISNDEFVL